MIPEDLEQIACVFRSECLRELREPMRYPPPSDLESERLVCAAALSGSNGLRLDPCDFYSPLFGSVYEMLGVLRCEGRTPSAELLLVALRDQGFIGEIERDLLALRDEVPSVDRRRLVEAAERITELAARRRLLALMGRLDAQLRTDATDYSQACYELTEFCNPVEP